MNTIKSYLEAMFANMPDTPEVIKAKDELLGMMEDKYNELISEGKSENEAVGTVISEFGNLDELADSLGLNSTTQETAKQSPISNKQTLSLDAAKHYIRAYTKRSLLISFGVMLCIFSPIFPIIGDITDTLILENIMISLMFVTIAVAVAMFILAGLSLKDYDDITKHRCILDSETLQHVKKEKEHMKPLYALCLAIGVILCIVCVIPPIIMDSFDLDILDDISGALVLAICSVGVMLIVFQANAATSYRRLLSLNNSEAISDNYNYTENNEEEYINSTVAAIISVFWPTISCLYLCISFLSFEWATTWIIWPVAAIVYKILKTFAYK